MSTSTKSNGLNIIEVAAHTAREDDGADVHLNDAAGRPLFHGEANDLPVTIRVSGTYSDRYRKGLLDLNKRWKKRRPSQDDTKDVLEEQIHIAASCVVGWSGVYDGDQPLPCTRESVLRVLRGAPWVREQVEVAMSDHERFFANGSAS